MEKEKLLKYKGLAPIRFLNDFNAGLLTEEEYKLIREVNKNDAWDRLEGYIEDTRSQNTTSVPSNNAETITSPGFNQQTRPLPQFKLRDDAKITQDFFAVPNAVIDVLAPLQTPVEEIIYRRMFRMSYGWKRNYCRVSIPKLLNSCQIKSENTIRKALHGLIEKGHIAEYINEKNRVDVNEEGTLYIVLLPEEIITGAKSKGSSNFTGGSKNAGVKFEATSKNNPLQILQVQKMNPPAQGIENTKLQQGGAKFGGAKNDGSINSGGVKFKSQLPQNLRVQKMNPPAQGIENTKLQQGGAKFEGAKNEPLLNTYLNTIVHTLSPREIITEFYKGIGQSRISKEKSERAENDLKELLDDGFSQEEIEFAVKWTIENSKEKPYDFSIIKHTIGQARAVKKEVEEKEAKRLEEERLKAQHQKEENRKAEELARIKTYRDDLPSDQRVELRKKALEVIRKMDGVKEEFVTESFIESQENEIIGRKLGISLSK